MRNKLIEEHRACPVGKAPQPHKGQPMVEHSKELQIVLDKLRRQPMAVKKYVTICKKDFEDYRIGIVTGVRGEPRNIRRIFFFRRSLRACNILKKNFRFT